MDNLKNLPLKKGTEYETLTSEEKKMYTKEVDVYDVNTDISEPVILWRHDNSDVRFHGY